MYTSVHINVLIKDYNIIRRSQNNSNNNMIPLLISHTLRQLITLTIIFANRNAMQRRQEKKGPFFVRKAPVINRWLISARSRKYHAHYTRRPSCLSVMAIPECTHIPSYIFVRKSRNFNESFPPRAARGEKIFKSFAKMPLRTHIHTNLRNKIENCWYG